MKKQFLNFFIFAIAGMILSSCSKKPQACIEVNKTVIRAGESISFLSCNEEADSYEWNFGDGKTATGNLASHTYEKEGTYLVQLIAYSKREKRWDKSQTIINVVPPVKRYLKGFRLNSFNITNASSQTWDSGNAPESNPDVFISFGIEGNQSFTTTNPVANLALSQCPILWDFSLNTAKFELINGSVSVQILDSDGATSELMHEFIFNPSTAIPANAGEIRLQFQNFQLDVLFIEK
jgi:hypothetical protein